MSARARWIHWGTAESWLVTLIALHSVVVGAFLLAATRWGLAFGGWEPGAVLFFPRQAGIFHLVVASGYLIEWYRYRGVTFLLTAKGYAVVFLGVMTVVDHGPWPLPLSGLADGLMALTVWWVHRAAAREREAQESSPAGTSRGVGSVLPSTRPPSASSSS